MIDEVIIRHVEPEDAAELHAIYQEPLVVQNTLRLPYVPRSAFERRAQPPEHVLRLVAVYQKQIVGDIALILMSNLRRRDVAALGMAVAPRFHGRGVGTRLMQAAIDLADNWLNLRRLELEVFTDNAAAVHLYKKFGFEIEGTLRQYAMRAGELRDVYYMARLVEKKS